MGIVYHGNYVHFFEIGRTEWLRSLGTTYKHIEENGIMLPVVSLNCNFKKSAYYDELLTIHTILKKTPTAKLEFEHEIRNEHNELLCTGNTTLVFVDSNTMRPIRCPEFILEKIPKNATL